MKTLGRVLGLACVCAALAARPSSVLGQSGTVTGIVINAATRQPIEGATVSIAGSTLQVLSRPNGAFAILAVPPGTYTVAVRAIGFGPREYTGVVVRVDLSRVLTIEMTASTTLEVIRIAAPPPPLVEANIVGSGASLTAEMLAALPVVDISEALTLAAGFLALPHIATLTSLAEERRGTLNSISVRGGRGGSTLSLVDGIPINNPLFGSNAIAINPLAVASVSFAPGYMEPQYGGGIAGMVGQVIREGADFFQGGFDYQTSAIAGLMGSVPDEARESNHARGYMSGPVPMTGAKLRFALAGEFRSENTTVLKFPDSVLSFAAPNSQSELLRQSTLRGWQGLGGSDHQQIVGKLTYFPTRTIKLSIAGISQVRNSLTFDRRYLYAYNSDPLSRVSTLMDSLALVDGRDAQGLVQGSMRENSDFVALRFERRFERSNLSFSLGQTGLNRQMCSVFQGVCVVDRFWQGGVVNGLLFPFVSDESPYGGSGLHFGGESFTSRSLRADYVMQATDHHRMQLGTQTTRHNISYLEVIGLNGGEINDGAGSLGQVTTEVNRYRARPVEVSTYVQDLIEYDFLTISFGVRFDHGSARAYGLTNPRTATNGTTAREVCNGTVPGVSETPFTYNGQTGVVACVNSPLNDRGRPFLIDSAAKMAQFDDFRKSRSHAAFSPRIGVSFPLTERSALFFNAGRYTKHPHYHDVYRNTGTGTRPGFGPGTDNLCDAHDVKPGTRECEPQLLFHPDMAEYVGNPNLANEQSTSYEVGFASQLGDKYAIDATVYAMDQAALSGLRRSSRTEDIQDIGATYGPLSLLYYLTILNTDYVATRGLSLGVRRRIVGRWGYNINYTWSRTNELGIPPDQQAETPEDIIGDSIRIERTSMRSRTHSFNVALITNFRDDIPRFWGSRILRNSRFSLTWSWSGGLRATEQTATAPGTPGGVNQPIIGIATAANPINLLYNKDLVVGSTRYGAFVRITNLFNTQSCCTAGLSLEDRRRLEERPELIYEPPERLNLRRLHTGLNVIF